MNLTMLIKLQELFGPTTTIEDVDVVKEFIHFAIPTHIDSDAYLTVDVIYCGVQKGKVHLMMMQEELERQIKTQDFINAHLPKLIQRINSESTNV